MKHPKGRGIYATGVRRRDIKHKFEDHSEWFKCWRKAHGVHFPVSGLGVERERKMRQSIPTSDFQNLDHVPLVIDLISLNHCSSVTHWE